MPPFLQAQYVKILKAKHQMALQCARKLHSKVKHGLCCRRRLTRCPAKTKGDAVRALPSEILALIAFQSVDCFTVELRATEDNIDVIKLPEWPSFAWLGRLADISPHFEFGVRQGILDKFDGNISSDMSVFAHEYELSPSSSMRWLLSLAKAITINHTEEVSELSNQTYAKTFELLPRAHHLHIESSAKVSVVTETTGYALWLLWEPGAIHDAARASHSELISLLTKTLPSCLSVTLGVSTDDYVHAVMRVRERRLIRNGMQVRVSREFFHDMRDVELLTVTEHWDGEEYLVWFDCGFAFDTGGDASRIDLDRIALTWSNSAGKKWTFSCSYLEKTLSKGGRLAENVLEFVLFSSYATDAEMQAFLQTLFDEG